MTNNARESVEGTANSVMKNVDRQFSQFNAKFVLRLSTLLGIFLWIVGFDTLTEKERLEAGVVLDGEGRDE